MSSYKHDPGHRDHEDFEGLAAGYGLHALEPEDEQRLAVHLLHCQSCSRLVADTAALGAEFFKLLAAEPVEPAPAGLRARILAAAAAEPRTFASPTGSEPVEISAPVTKAPSFDVPRAVLPRHGAGGRRSPMRRIQVRSRIAVGVLAAVLGVGIAVPVTLAVSDSGRAPSSTSALAQALLQPGAREVTLHGESGSSVAKAVMSDKGMYLIASGLPVNDRARSVYVLWAANNDGVRTAVATFDVRSGAPVQMSASKLPIQASNVSQVAVSYESGRKAPAKPSDVVLSGSAV